MSKNVVLVIPGTGEEAEAHDAPIKAGNTPADLLRAAGKDPANWQIQIKRGKGFKSLSGADDLFSAVKDGDKVFAVPADIVVG